MATVKREILYFREPGPKNTGEVFEAARRRCEELGIKDVVVASNTGETGAKACKMFKGFNLVVVREYTGRRGRGVQLMGPEAEREILKDAKIITATHALSGVERALRKKFLTIGPVDAIAQAFKVFGTGVKVCIEIVLMATDAGLIPVDREVMSIAGTSRGADTALVVKPANSAEFFDLYVKEVVAKPREPEVPSSGARKFPEA